MDAEELRSRRARSFGATAAAYAEHRPDYPADGIRWGLAAASGEVRRVLDLAAGTGKLDRRAARAGARGDGRRAGRRRCWRSCRTGSRRCGRWPATAEAIPLPDASVDAVVVGQAFHWFDREAALAEIARVLRPGGALAAFWNAEDDVAGWMAGLGEVARSSVTQTWTADYPTFDGDVVRGGREGRVPAHAAPHGRLAGRDDRHACRTRWW